MTLAVDGEPAGSDQPNYVVKNGTIESHVLFETRFSNFHDQGVVGISGDRAEDVIEILTEINSHAQVA